MTRQHMATVAALAALMMMTPALPADRVTVYPEALLPHATEFTVKANGLDIAVYNTGTFRCAPFAFSGTVKVEVTYQRGPVTSYQINPLSKGVRAQQQGQTLTFTLARPQNLEVQINGATSQVVDGDKLLYLFAETSSTPTAFRCTARRRATGWRAVSSSATTT